MKSSLDTHNDNAKRTFLTVKKNNKQQILATKIDIMKEKRLFT